MATENIENEFLVCTKIKNVFRNIIMSERENSNFDLNNFFLKGKFVSQHSFDEIRHNLKISSVINIHFPVLRAHQIESDNVNLDGIDIEMFDQHRAPLTPRMIEISLKNYKSWMNTGFYIEISFSAGSSLGFNAEREVIIHFVFVVQY